MATSITKDDVNKIITRLNGMSFIGFVTLIAIITCIILVIVFCLIKTHQTCIENSKIASINCSDCNSCTNDFLNSNLYCTNENKLTGVPCDSTDPCFNHSSCTPTCNQGTCTGPQTCCLGYCNQDSDCPVINVTTNGMVAICQTQFNSCLYFMGDTSTSQCLALIANESLINCLEYRFTFTVMNNGECDYWFKCAPLYFGTGVASITRSQNVSFYY